jgi:carbamoyltransferase
LVEAQSNGFTNNGLPRIEPIGPLYFGHQLTDDEITTALGSHKTRVGFERCEDIDRRTAELLADDKIVGRVRGPMEWGARALGNRSIVASPKSLETVRRINAAIKMRDFWMPFAPSILWERRNDYLVNHKDSDAPYMIVAFESTELAQKELTAGLHPFDLTCRPQLVHKEWNGPYHHMIEQFEKLTGTGGVLNTSFNLHGEPIVMTAADAISTLLNSGLDFVTLEDYLVWPLR